MKVLIVGAGIGGLVLAAFLKKKHITITIIDKASDWRHLGYSLAIWNNGRNIVSKLGLQDEFDAKGFVIPQYNVADSSGNSIKFYHFEDFKRNYHPAMVQIGRGDLHKILFDAAGIPIKMKTRVVRLSDTPNGVDVTFDDNTQQTFDLVVGADGVHSQIRDIVFGKEKAKHIMWRAWYFWSDLTKLNLPEGIFETAENGEFFGMFPSSKTKGCGILAMPFHPGHPDPVETRLKRLHEHFKDLGWTVKDVLDGINKPEDMIHTDIAFVDLHTWYKGRIVLLGDAVHAMEPFAGMGASMALEDAYVLAEELGKEQLLEKALFTYQKRRIPRVERARAQTRQIWNVTKIKSPLLCRLRDIVLRIAPTNHFTKGFEEILKRDL